MIEGVQNERIDVSETAFTDVVKAFRPTAVVHAAGPASVGSSFENPAPDFRSSALTWLNVLESVRASGLDVLALYVSSAAVYGQPELLPVSEEAGCRPVSPYGFHKLACENMADEYSTCFGIRTLSARIFSLFGPQQRRLLTWELSQQLWNDDRFIRVRGTGEETRDFLHVDDAADAILDLCRIGQSQTSGEHCLRVNIARGEETTVADLCQRIVSLSQSPKQLMFEGLHSSGDPQRWAADIGRLRSLIPQWRPMTLSESINDCLCSWRVVEEEEESNHLGLIRLTELPRISHQ